MFYTYVEKNKSSFYESWEPRQLAFDCATRHLYYSEPIPHSLRKCLSDSAAVEGCEPSELTFLKKGKVLSYRVVAASKGEHRPEWRERDFYQIDITCEARKIAPGEAPPRGPCLCPSAEPVRPSLVAQRRAAAAGEDDALLHDPHAKMDLYDACRALFRTLKTEKLKAQQEAAEAGRSPPAGDGGTLTISTPRAANDSAPIMPFSNPAPTMMVFVRCRSETDFQRLRYVLNTVLGFDGVMQLPYEGLPPFDPRNGVFCETVPLNVFPTFAHIDNTIFYTFIKGDALTCGDGDHLHVSAADVYCVVTHDSIFLVRHNGNYLYQVSRRSVSRYYHNSNSATPFFAIESDVPGSNFVFRPTRPVYNKTPVELYNPQYCVRRMTHVLRGACCASLLPQRVITSIAVSESSPQRFYAAMQRGNAYEHRLDLRSKMDRAGGREFAASTGARIGNAWATARNVELSRAQPRRTVVAVPIYAETTHQLALSNEQIGRVEAVLDDMRERLDDITGLPVDAVLRLTTQAAAGAPENQSDYKSLGTWDNDEKDGEEAYEYPNARYFTADEATSTEETTLPDGTPLYKDQHEIVSSPTLVKRRASSTFDMAQTEEQIIQKDLAGINQILSGIQDEVV